MSFTINNKLPFIGSIQFLSFSLDSLDNNVFNLVKEKRLYPYEYMTDFEKFKEELPSKEKFYSSITHRKVSDKEYEHVSSVWKKFEIKTIKDYHDLFENVKFYY